MEQRDLNENVEAIETPAESMSSEAQVSYSLKDFFKMIGRHWIALILGGLIGLAGGIVYGRYIQKPKYQATSSIYILDDNGSGTAQEVITVAKNMARIASNYMTQSEVREQACKLLTGDATYLEYVPENTYPQYKSETDGVVSYNISALKKSYSVTLEQFSSNDTSIFLHVTTTTKNADLSIDMANAVVCATRMLTENGETGTVAGTLKGYVHPMAPANDATNTATSAVVLASVGVVLGLVVGAGYGILRELLNTKVSTKRELEIITGIKVIGMIPNYIEKKPEESTLEADDEAIKEGK